MMGMNERRFSSKPSQVLNQVLDEIAIRMPSTNAKPNIIRLGFEFKIKKRSDLHRRGMSPLA